MKYIFPLLFLLQFVHLPGQDINYCNYFTFIAEETFSYTEINLERNDKFSNFLKNHGLRFEYVLANKVAGLRDIADIYPDTIRLRQAFCKAISKDSTVQGYFKNLTPNSFSRWESSKQAFSFQEMMLVASRFFYSDRINENDTTVGTHICVGIHGQNEILSDRDLTLLEAFAIEGIFYFLSKDKSPEFERNFYACVRHSTEMHKKNFTTFDGLLISVQSECFAKMKNNKHLQESLLKYYRKNKNNLNFKIEDSF